MGIDACMIVGIDSDVTDHDILEWSYRLALNIGYNQFLIERNPLDYPQHVLSRFDPLSTDLFVFPKDDPYYTTYLRVNQAWRHFSNNYPRGYWPVILATGLLLKQLIPYPHTVYYGNDSSFYMEPFDPNAILTAATVAKPYGYGWHSDTAPTCDFCQQPMICDTSAPTYLEYSCPGCGHETIVATN